MAMPPYTVEQVIQRGYDIIARHPGYSQDWDKRLGPYYYDCSGFQGVINGIPGGPATPDMVTYYTAAGYIHLKFTSLSALKKGDVLVYNKPGTPGYGSSGHTAMYIGNNTLMESWGHHGPGVRAAWGNGYWQDILRNPRSGIYITHWSPTDGKGGGF